MALLRTRRWLAFTALVLVAIIGFGFLSRWQWQRADEHRRERIALNAALAQSPADLGGLVGALTPWTPVVATGVYDPQVQAVVRKRPMDAMNGFWMMTALRLADGRSVWVNRGWLPVGGDALATPEFPAPPPGTVTVTGYVREFEDADEDANTGLPAGQVAAPNAALLPSGVDGVDGYVQLATSAPEQTGLRVLPPPEVEVDEGRNISYAIQWILFAIIAIGGWFFFLRREAADDAARAQQPSDPTPTPTPGSP